MLWLDQSTELYLSAIWESLFKISTIFVDDFQSGVHISKTRPLILAGHNHSLWNKKHNFSTSMHFQTEILHLLFVDELTLYRIFFGFSSLIKGFASSQICLKFYLKRLFRWILPVLYSPFQGEEAKKPDCERYISLMIAD